jgi:HlyD family secretion protein
MIMPATPAAIPPPPSPDGDAGPNGSATLPRQPRRGRPAKAHPHRNPRLIAAAVVLAIATGVALLLRPKPIAVDIALATVGPLRATVDADAVTRVRNRFTVTAPVDGLVHRLAVTEGDVVRIGQVVARIAAAPVHETDRRVALAKLDAVRAAGLQADQRLLAATEALAQAQRDDRRARTLLAAGAMAEHDAELAALTVTNRRAELNVARAQQRVARDELAQARAALDAMLGTAGTTLLVRAPASGRVLGIPERSSRVVAAGAPLLEIGDDTSLEVVADVLSSDAASVRAGQRVELHGWGGAPLYGVVRLVEPSARTRISALGVEEQRLKVVIDLPSAPASLADGYRLDARIVVWDAPHVLTVPAGALLRTDGAWAVYAVREGRAARVPVRIGHLGAGAAEVLGGLRRGDSVIVFAPDALKEGTRVKRGE